MTQRIIYCVFSRLLYLHFVTMLILDPTALCIFYPGGPTTTASPTLSAQQSSRWVRGRRNTFVGLVLHSSPKSRKTNQHDTDIETAQRLAPSKLSGDSRGLLPVP